jgi:hypothetical protein
MEGLGGRLEMSVRKRIFSACLVLLLSPAFSAAQDGADVVEKKLRAFVAGKEGSAGLIIVYDDLHELWGGTRTTISGDSGDVQHQVSRPSQGKKSDRVVKQLSQEELLELAQMLIDLEAWVQKVPDRKPRPDESRTHLHIHYQDASSSTWEWHNDLKQNNRLIRVLHKLREFAPLS